MQITNRSSSALLAAVFLLSACASPSSRPLTTTNVPSKVEVVAVLSDIQSTPNLDVSNGFLVDYVMPPGGVSPGLTLNQTLSGPGIVGGAIASVLISALIGNDTEQQQAESRQILARYGNVFTPEYPKILLQQKLSSIATKPADILIDRIAFVSGNSITAGDNIKLHNVENARLTLVFKQSLSLDLSKLRLHLQAVATRANGEELIRQNYYFLPVSVDGATKETAMETWSSKGGKVYKEQMNLGTEAVVEALNLAFFSYKNGSQQTSKYAAEILKRTNCYGGDYDVGIPMDAYKNGVVMAIRDKYTIIKLANNDVITFPTCQ